MLEYFLTNGNKPVIEPDIQYPNIIHPHWKYLTDRVLFNLNRSLDYYIDTELFVNNMHPINVYLKMLLTGIDLDQSDELICSNVIKRTDLVSRQCGVTTLLRMGIVHKNIFYNGESYEALYAVNRVPNLNNISTDWKNKKPIKITTTNDDVLTFYTFNGKMIKYEPSFSTFCINPITLVLCYKYWLKNREHTTHIHTTQSYLATFVFPRIYWNMLGLVVFNKVMNLREGTLNIIEPESLFKHPFYIKNYDLKVNQTLVEIMPRYLDYPIGLVGRVLHVIRPLLFNRTARHCLLIDNLNTRQSKWLIYTARLPYCLSIIKYLGQKGHFASNDVYNKLRLLLRELDNNKAILKDPLPLPIQDSIQNTIKKIKKEIL